MIKERIVKALIASAELRYELNKLVNQTVEEKIKALFDAAEKAKSKSETTCAEEVPATPEEVVEPKKRKYNKHKKEA